MIVFLFSIDGNLYGLHLCNVFGFLICDLCPLTTKISSKNSGFKEA